MAVWVDAVLVCLALTGVFLLGSSRLTRCIRIVAFQGVLLGGLTLAVRAPQITLRVVFLAAAGSVLARGIDVENCGCTSLAKTEATGSWPPAWTKGVGWFLVTRNLVMLGVALLLAGVEPARAEAEGRAAPGNPAAA